MLSSDGRSAVGAIASQWRTGPTRGFNSLSAGGASAAFWDVEAEPAALHPALEATAVCIFMTDAPRHDMWLDERWVASGVSPAGSLRILPPGSEARFHIDAQDAHQGRYRFMQFYAPVGLLTRLGFARGELSRQVEPGRVDDRMLALVDLLARTSEDDALEREHLALAALAHVAARHAPEPRAAAPATLAGWRRRTVAAFLDAHADRDVAVAELAAVVGMSVHHFGRAFRSTFGMPPHRYQMRLKLGRAKTLLATSRLEVAEIALSVGFNDPAYLARRLKAETGLTPLAYRRLVGR